MDGMVTMQNSSIKKTVVELLTGYAIGAANIIPGGSGGTFLLIFGLYEIMPREVLRSFFSLFHKNWGFTHIGSN